MRFKKIYIEITNSCNFGCSFCFKTTRQKKFMTVDEFRMIVEKVRPFTNYIYLHVLGEPLLHPRLEEILSIAESSGLNTNMTTNGSLIDRKKEILLQHPVRQINISLHDAEENLATEEWDSYLSEILDFAGKVSPSTYVNLRLWNSSNESSKEFNSICLSKISERYGLSNEYLLKENLKTGVKLAEHIFLQHAPRFEWPDESQPGNQTTKKCYALRDHIAILCDGQVVPCCLDADAKMKLGDIFTEDLNKILETKRALDIKKGFDQHKIVESLCTTCGFMI